MQLRRRDIRPTIAFAAAIAFIAFSFDSARAETGFEGVGLFAVAETTKGRFVMELRPDQAPLSAMAFVGLAEGSLSMDSRPYYDGMSFPVVAPGALAYAGAGLGSGGAQGVGIRFPRDPEPSPRTLSFSEAGTVGMLASGGYSDGSSFFVTLGPLPEFDRDYSAFARVVEGMSVVESLAEGDRIIKLRIVRSGDAARAYLADRRAFERAYYLASIPERSVSDGMAPQVAAFKRRFPGLEPWKEGAYMAILTPGEGEPAAEGMVAFVHYRVSLPDGTVVDSSYGRGTPEAMELDDSSLVRGVLLALLDMRVGERRVIVIPPELGYGDFGYPGVIPAATMVAFELELVRLGQPLAP